MSENSFILEEIAKGLSLKYPELGLLIESLQKFSTPYDFFRTVAMHIMPVMRKSKPFKALINRWEREMRASKKELEGLNQKALQEVTTAFQLLEKRIKNNKQLKAIPGIQQTLDKAKKYLQGTRLVYTPSHFEMAADAMASACRLVLKHGDSNVLSDLVKIGYLNDNIDAPVIDKCYFYNSINKIVKKHQEWRWEICHFSYICWYYLKFTERLWHLQEKVFEEKTLKNSTIEECKESNELLGLHSYWVELQSIRNKRQNQVSFFTIQRFSKYLQVICSEILTLKPSDSSATYSLGLTSISLTMDGEYLLLIVEENNQNKTPYLLHKFTGISGPYDFFKYLIKNPGKDTIPSEFGMLSNTSSNLLNRSNIKELLRKLFFKKGMIKGSIQLHACQIDLKNQDISVRLRIEKQIKGMSLSVYKNLIK